MTDDEKRSPAMAIEMGAQSGLAGGIQTLPQELQDMILHFILVAGAGRIVTITPDYRPPTQLQVSRATRKTAASAYYSDNMFQVNTSFLPWSSTPAPWSVLPPAAWSILEQESVPSPKGVYATTWLRNLPHEHRRLIREIRIPMYDDYFASYLKHDFSYDELREMAASDLALYLFRMIKDLGLEVLEWIDVLKTDWKAASTGRGECVNWLGVFQLKQVWKKLRGW